MSHLASPPVIYGERLKITGFGHVLVDASLTDANNDYLRFGTGPGTNVLEFYVYSPEKTDN